MEDHSELTILMKSGKRFKNVAILCSVINYHTKQIDLQILYQDFIENSQHDLHLYTCKLQKYCENILKYFGFVPCTANWMRSLNSAKLLISWRKNLFS